MGRTTFSGPVVSNNGFEGNITGDITGAIQLPKVLIAALPAAATNTGPYIATNAAAGPVLVYSNGTIWVDVLTGIAVTA